MMFSCREGRFGTVVVVVVEEDGGGKVREGLNLVAKTNRESHECCSFHLVYLCTDYL